MPLSSYGKPFSPPLGKVDPGIDVKTAVREQVNALDIVAYFNLLATLMSDNPPAAADAPIIAKMAKLRIKPAAPFDFALLKPSIQAVLKDAPKVSFEKILPLSRMPGKISMSGHSPPRLLSTEQTTLRSP